MENIEHGGKYRSPKFSISVHNPVSTLTQSSLYMQLTKFTLTDSQFKCFERWFLTHYNYKLRGINLPTVNRFLGHHWGVQMLNWPDQSFVTLTPANAGFFVLAMSSTANSEQ